MRKGKKAIYKNKEYTVIKKDEDKVELISKDEKDVIENGFKPSYDHGKLQLGIYEKEVSKKELQTAYKVRTYGEYKKGECYQITGEKDDYYIMPVPRGTQAAKELKQYVVEKTRIYVLANKNQITLIEKRKPIWGFEIPEEEQWIEISND